jgi:hypothetical protein
MNGKRKLAPAKPPCGVHAGGRDDYMATSADARLRGEEAKLDRRIGRFCCPKGLLGHFTLLSRRRGLRRKLKARFVAPYAVFLGAGQC